MPSTEELEKFEGFPKIERFAKSAFVTVTEKIDGTNAQVVVFPDGRVKAASRNRWLYPGAKETDNFGFAAWVEENTEMLRGLGIGRHYGEWWGLGIQRGYGMDRKLFSLFDLRLEDSVNHRVTCCRMVPLLYKGSLEGFATSACMDVLKKHGSVAAPGFPNPEGIIVDFCGRKFKTTFDDRHKGEAST